MRKIILTGAESTGKTTLARQLAEYYQTLWVPEYARDYLDQLRRPYQKEDLLLIAEGQLKREEELEKRAKDLIFLDTSMLVLKVWSEYKYGDCHPWILGQLHQRSRDLHLLCPPDLPWTFDPQRENPGEREELFEIYRRELERLRFPFRIVSGKGAERLNNAIEVIEHYSLKSP